MVAGQSIYATAWTAVFVEFLQGVRIWTSLAALGTRIGISKVNNMRMDINRHARACRLSQPNFTDLHHAAMHMHAIQLRKWQFDN